LAAGVLAAVGPYPATAEPMAKLRVEVTGFEQSKGNSRLALHNGPHSFPDKTKLVYKFLITPVEDGRAVHEAEIPYGEYAIAGFHDANANGKFDKNLMGIPKEAYGFSNGAKAKWGPPSWDAVRFKVDQPLVVLEIRFEKW
jgi:uncharacterized protein (DUF2141 family)